MPAMARHKARGARIWLLVVTGVVAVAGITVGVVTLTGGSASHPHAAVGSSHRQTRATKRPALSAAPTTTTTSTLPPPAAGFVPGHVTAVGDSVMLDYQTPLEADIPGIDVEAAVSRQWATGEAILSQLKAEGQLGAEVIVALGTNGPITDTDFDDMMNALQGASRVVFVNVHVDRPWQDPNNAVLARGAARYPRVYIADWATVAAANPLWFGPDGTHLAINGTGADDLAALITTTVTKG
jgi:hypothetical protein